MATTRESVHDGIVWIRDLVLVWLRWGLVLGLVFGLFGLAVWLTRGEDFGNCEDVSTEQRGALESLGVAADGAAFTAPPRCSARRVRRGGRGGRGSIERRGRRARRRWMDRTGAVPSAVVRPRRALPPNDPSRVERPRAQRRRRTRRSDPARRGPSPGDRGTVRSAAVCGADHRLCAVRRAVLTASSRPPAVTAYSRAMSFARFSLVALDCRDPHARVVLPAHTGR